MSIDEVRARIAELSAELDRSVDANHAWLAGFSGLSERPPDLLVAQARVELAVYTGAMKSVGALFRRAIESGDLALAQLASTVMTAMEESLALARATVDELLREDTHAV